MFTPFVSIGIDISKASLDVYGLPTHQPASFSNHAEAIATLLTALTESAPDCIVCEPSGGYERSLVATAGNRVTRGTCQRSRGEAKGIVAKTDRLDARLLAEYGALLKPGVTTAKRPAILAEHVQRQRQLVSI